MMDFFSQLEDVDPYWTQHNILHNPYAPSDAHTHDVEMRSSPPRPPSPFQPVLSDDLEVERPLHVLSESPQVAHDQDRDQDDMDFSLDPLGDELNATAMNQVSASDDMLATSSTIQVSPHERVRSLEGKPPPELNTRKTPPPPSPTKTSTQTTPSKPKYDPLVLLTPSKRRNRTPTPEKTAAGSTENQDGVSGLSLIERLHNVGERDQLESKKRKLILTEDGDDAQKKAKFDGNHSGGMLGDALKKEAKKVAENSGPPTLSASNTIDLTADDDDDVVFLEELEKEVCLGMLQNAKVNADFVPMPRTKTFQGSTTQWPQIRVDLQRPLGPTGQRDATYIIKCRDPMGRTIGSIGYDTAVVLAPLMDSAGLSSLRLTSWLKPRKKRAGEVPGMPCSEHLDIYIILYAPKSKAIGVGRFLGQSNVWLREPPMAMVQKGILYWNPQAPAPPRHLDEIDDSIQQGSGFGGAGPAKNSTFTRTVEETAGDMKELFDKLAKGEKIPESDTPEDVITPLLAHQRQALTFLTSREKTFDWADENDQSEAFSLWKTRHTANGNILYYNTITGHEVRQPPTPSLGGILADMMGLGKTLSILSLIVSTKGLAYDFAEEAAVPRTPQRILKCNLKATLLVVPLSTIQNWEEQIRTHIKRNKLKVYVHHGPKRVQDVFELQKYDVVISCYPTLSAEWRRTGSMKPMFDANWFRIVLDEAHTIRNQDSGFFKSCCDLMGPRRWAVTGTPVQNRLEDLGALFQFLKIAPFDRTKVFNQYFISAFKIADPEILPKLRLLVDGITLRRLKKDTVDLPEKDEKVVRLTMSDKERRMYDFFAADSNKVVRAVTANGKMGSRSYAQILKQISRLRRICAHGEELLNEEDLKIAQGVHKENAIEINDDDDGEDAPPLTDKQAMEMFYLLRESDFDRCEKCNKKIYDLKDIDDHEGEDSSDGASDTVGFMTSCYHMYCPGCIDEFRTEMTESMADENYMNCPRCAQYVRAAVYEIKESELTKDQRNKAAVRKDKRMAQHLARYGGPHSKVIHLLEALAEYKTQSEEDPTQPPIKTVIFSEWTNHLDLIQIALETAGHKYARLDGSMTRKNRTLAIDTFREDPTITIMLATIGAAGLGLNLTVANKVFVMEPQYNPQAEAQAVDRVHRLGQTRPVTITWIIMNKTFEEHMLELQRKKKALADLSMDRKGHLSKEEEKKSRLKDLQSLFK